MKDNWDTWLYDIAKLPCRQEPNSPFPTLFTLEKLYVVTLIVGKLNSVDSILQISSKVLGYWSIPVN